MFHAFDFVLFKTQQFDPLVGFGSHFGQRRHVGLIPTSLPCDLLDTHSKKIGSPDQNRGYAECDEGDEW